MQHFSHVWFLLYSNIDQGSRWSAIRAKKSPCEGWLRFLVGQKRSSSRIVILKSRPMSPPAYFLHLSFIEYFESDFLGK
jgi:hypothetical protein